MPAPVLVPLSFQDLAGNPLAYGRVDIFLQHDMSEGASGGPQVVAGLKASLRLDVTGSTVASLWPNDTLSPSTFYFAQAFRQCGQLVWSGEITVNTLSYILLEDGSLIWLESGPPNAIFTE